MRDLESVDLVERGKVAGFPARHYRPSVAALIGPFQTKEPRLRLQE